MSKKTCGCVGVMPKHLKVIIGLGARRVAIDDREKYGTTAEDLAELLQLEEGTVLDSLDDLMGCDVVKDVDVTVFYLTKLGEDLFHGILEAVKEINQ